MCNEIGSIQYNVIILYANHIRICDRLKFLIFVKTLTDRRRTEQPTNRQTGHREATLPRTQALLNRLVNLYLMRDGLCSKVEGCVCVEGRGQQHHGVHVGIIHQPGQ